ncbi:hypothetical protein DXG01_012970 [Tephrocybe rancida]|nr:hypothetical protein DXG01_012970 [Tephrocybe rancida]
MFINLDKILDELVRPRALCMHRYQSTQVLTSRQESQGFFVVKSFNSKHSRKDSEYLAFMDTGGQSQKGYYYMNRSARSSVMLGTTIEGAQLLKQ